VRNVDGPMPTLEEPRAPAEPYGRLFLRFVHFGFNAWGGPPAQIAMIREELVDRGRWISTERFHRTLAVYQVLPGPEATEMCCHLGMLSRGRTGAVLAGLGFMLPGFALMLLVSAIYSYVGIYVATLVLLASGFAPAVAALVVKATHSIATHALRERFLLATAGAAAAATLLGAAFYLVLPATGIAAAWRTRWRTIVVLALAAGVFLAAWASTSPGTGVAGSQAGGSDPGLLEITWSGLKAGLLTFGGAYTALPFLAEDSIGPDGWLSSREFVDGVALAGMLPAPLIIFATFVGFLGGGWAGAVAITVAIFLPAFAFTLIGFRHLERVAGDTRLHSFLDGVTAGVVGIIAVTAVGLVLLAVQDALTLGVFLVALTLLVHWRSKAAVPLTILLSGLAALLLSARW
jgi:chromate transporter